MRCPACQSTVVRERPERTAQGYRRFRCLTCKKQFNNTSRHSTTRAMTSLGYCVRSLRSRRFAIGRRSLRRRSPRNSDANARATRDFFWRARPAAGVFRPGRPGAIPGASGRARPTGAEVKRWPRVRTESRQEFIRMGKSLPLPVRRSIMGFNNRNCGPRRRLSGKARTRNASG